jgi:hypothetical protein
VNDEMTDGGCLCGAIRYRVYGKPLVSNVCHCPTCRRSTGSPVVAWLTFPTQRFSVLRGQLREFHSSPPVTRTFCPRCGTPLTYLHSERLSEIDVTTGSLDNPDAFPPSHHSWVGHRVRWVRFGDGLPTYSESEGG